MLPEVNGEGDLITKLAEQGKQLLKTPVFETTKFYNKEWFHYSALSKLFAEAMLDFTQADCTMFNAGIFLDHLKKEPLRTMISIEFYLTQLMCV